MKVFNQLSPIEEKLQAVELLLQRLKLTISWNGRFVVTDNEYNATGYLTDIEGNDLTLSLPRMVESERIVIP